MTMNDARPPAAETVMQPDEVMFSPAVRNEQACRGSREAYARRAAAGHFAQTLSANEMAFIAQRDSAFLATASADGQPYVQHRGGPPGFLRVLNDHTIAFLEYPGNRQFISIGHLAENERAFMFLMDYANALRLKSQPYRPEEITNTVDRCIAAFTAETFAERSGGCEATIEAAAGGVSAA